MAQITPTTGLISGINTKDIIDQLMSIESQQTDLIQARIDSVAAQKAAYGGLTSMLTSIQSSGFALSRPTTFDNSNAASSDDSILTATTSVAAPVGNYQFQVAQLVTNQQSISQGFANADTAPVGAGTITIELGGGEVSSQTTLAQLNGGSGAARGQFRITDRSGHSQVIDTTNAVTLDDVVKKINTSLDISIRASVQDNHLVLTDNTGSTSQNLTVADLGSGTAASSLGIAGTGAGNTLTGSNINTLNTTSLLSSFNDGRGVRTSSSGADFTLTTADRSSFNITLGADATLGDVINTINTATGGKITATIDSATNSLKLTDSSSHRGGTLSVTALAGSSAAGDLGLAGQTAAGSVLQGKSVLASLDSVLLSSLNGGAGLTLGKMNITNRLGHATTVDLSGASSLRDVIDDINNAGGAKVTASINQAGNGIAISDISGGTGNLTVADNADGTTSATKLGIAQSVGITKSQINGSNLQRQYISESSLLSTYKGGTGVAPGSFSITNSTGTSKTFNTSTLNTLGDVIKTINATNMGVTASIDSTGTGLLLTDTAGGAGTMAVKDITGTTAKDLQIAGAATGTTLDGTFEKTISVSATDTLTSVQQKLQTLGFGVKANLLNDGSAGAPYRLSLTAENTGLAGRVVIDAGTTNLQTQTLVNAQDAAVFVGGDSSAQPLLVTSSNNTITGVLPGVTLSLNGVSSSPVSLAITRDTAAITDQIQNYVTNFNAAIDSLNTLTKWDSDTDKGGILLGDYTAQSVQQELYASFQGIVTGAGKYRSFADIGLSLDDNAEIKFDTDKFAAAYADDPDAVQNLFTQADTGIGAIITKKMTDLIDPIDGTISLQNQTLDNKTTQFQAQITQQNTLIDQKRNRLEEQFANMESVLSQLQSQQTSIDSLATSASASSKK